MIKAYLMRADNQISLTPDISSWKLDKLKAWTERKTDPVARAVLNSVTGYYLLQQSKEVNEAFVYFLRSRRQECLGCGEGRSLPSDDGKRKIE